MALNLSVQSVEYFSNETLNLLVFLNHSIYRRVSLINFSHVKSTKYQILKPSKAIEINKMIYS